MKELSKRRVDGFRILKFLCFVLIAALFVSTLSAVAATKLPTVERLQGVAKLKIKGEREWKPLKADMEIPVGARIQTLMGTRVMIRLENNSILSLKENSVFDVLRNDNRGYEFKLWMGDVRSQVQRLGPSRSFEIRTPIAVAGVRGTDFMLTATEGGATELSVYEGIVELQSLTSGAAAMVGADQSASVDASGRLSDIQAGTQPDEDEDPVTETESGDLTEITIPLTVTAPQPGAVVASKTVTIMGNATPGVKVSIGGIITTADAAGRFSATVTLSEGTNSVIIVSGNQSKEVEVIVDSLAPTIDVGAFSEITRFPSLSLSVTTKAGATVSALGISSVATSGMATLQLTLSEGENLITIESADPRGLTSQKTIRAVLDTIKPNLTIISMTQTQSGVRVSGLTEPGVVVTANGYPLEIRSDGSFDQVLAGLTATEITFEARDLAGNVTRDIRNVTGQVDNDPPSLVGLSFTPTSAEVGSSIQVNLSLQDASDLAPSTTFTMNGPSGATLSTTLSASGKSYVGRLNVPSTAPGGTYSPSAVTVADVLGNSTSVSPSTSLLVSNTAPPPPSSVAATDATTGGKATVSWSTVTVSDFMDYSLYQAPSAGGPWSLIFTGTTNSKTLANLVDGTTYYFHVKTRDLAGNVSQPSTVASVTPSDQVAPASPTGLTASAQSSTSISLAWSPSSGANNYKVYRSLSAGGGAPWQLVAQTASTNHTVTGLSPSTTYHFSVTALDNNTAPPTNAPNESTVGTSTASATTTP